ncbi:MAG TPA: glycosyltransferase [Firmicutes bacterium]|nr:glycosyltransferase [Bacillota bacterium]
MTVVQCSNCGLRSIVAVPEDLDEYYGESYFLKPGEGRYQEKGYSDYDRIPDSEFLWRLNLLGLFGTNRGKLLDVGCATGKFMTLALRAGWDVEGIDVSPFAVQVARKKGLKVHLGTVESLTLPPESFDVVTAFDVLEHVPDIRSFLEAIYTILKPGGKLILLSPDAGSFRAIAMAERWIGYRTSLKHVHYFDMRFLRAALTEVFQDRHLTVAEFERGEYDYLLGVAQKVPSRVHNPLQDLRMKVLFVNRPDSFWMPGGDVVQMLETKYHLEDLDVKIDISLSEHPIGVGYDLAHVFNSQIAYQEFEQVRHLKQIGLPVCLSTIYWDETETKWADVAVRAIFKTAKNEAQLQDYLDEFRNQRLEIKGISPVSPSPFYAMVKSVQRRLFEQVDYLLPNSQLEMREISLRHGICNKPFTVVPNGVNPEVFLDADPKPFIEKFGIKDFVILAGRLEGRKNQLLALYALRNEDIPIVVVGSQYDRDYAELCKKWAAQNVLFIDHLPQRELASAYAAARVCVLPSWMESTGLVALEAALADCSVVVTNRGATWGYFGELAYYCNPLDPESIREATLRAYHEFENDQPRREKLRDLILSQYNWKQAAEKTLIGYENTLAIHAQSSLSQDNKSVEGREYQVSIIIPVFNKIEYTVRCLQALEANTPKNLRYEVIIVDNASTDATPDILAGLEGDVTIVRNERNLGFACACNQGAKLARGDYLVFLNNDTEPQPGWLEALLARALEERVGVVGAKLLFPDGRIQHVGVAIASDPTIGVSIVPQHIYHYWPDNLDITGRPRDLQAVTGACMLIMKPLFDLVGGFNEAYYNGHEDIDLCFRVRSLGYRVVYEPRSTLVHHESISGPERYRKVSDNVILLNTYWSGKIKPDDQDIYLADGFFARFAKEGNQWRRELRQLPKISIVLRVGQDREMTKSCVQSLVKWTPLPAELLLAGPAVTYEIYEGISSTCHGSFEVKVPAKGNAVNCGNSTNPFRTTSDPSGEYVVFLEDTCLVSEGWLEGLLKCLESHPMIGAVGPVSNVSNAIQLPYISSEKESLPWAIKEIADRLRSTNKGVYPMVRDLEGFCFATKTWIIKEMNICDEVLLNAGSGSSLKQILAGIVSAGYQFRVATDVYIHRRVGR